jgi:hypothetical protein
VYHFCTYFDRNFLIKGLTLYRSLIANVPRGFTLWVLCLDDFTHETLSKLALEGVRPISMSEFEAGDSKLLEAKTNRSRVEYFFTCTPSLPLFVFRQNAEVEIVSYLDADLFFFSSPAPIFQELGGRSVLIIGHRYDEQHRHLEQYGIYNVGLLSFRNDAPGRECLEWWRARCLEWCYDRVEEGRFADQKYLDDWPERFTNVVVLRRKGANVAPWNVFQYRVTQKDGRVRIDDEDLIFYHFHRLKRLNRWFCDPGLSEFRKGAVSREIRNLIYRPYLHALNETWEWLRTRAPEAGPGYARAQNGRYGYRNLMGDAARSFLKGQLIVS